jgi:hypothetical protein
MSTQPSEPSKALVAQTPKQAPSPAQEAITILADFEQHLRAEAGFRGAPGEQIYDCYRIIRLADRCKKAAEKLSVPR